MISPLARSLWPLGTCPPGTPLGSQNLNPIVCVVGDSEGAGSGTSSGNAWRKYLNEIALASGMTITWKGNLITGDYVPTQRTQCVVGATVADHLASGSINTPQYFGVGQPLHPCDGFLYVLGSNDAAAGAGGANALAFDTNLALLYSQLQAKEPGSTNGTVYIARGGDATRNSGIDFINANKVAQGVALIQAAGGLIALGDNRLLSQLPGTPNGGQGAQFLGTESPSWLHEADAACVLTACALWPVVCNMFGFAAVWPGDPLT